MRSWRKPALAKPAWAKPAGAAVGAILFLAAGAGPVSADRPAIFGPPCDQYDPAAPVGSARITLNASDFVRSRGDRMRSFIETGSIGKADVTVVGATPPGAVLALSAVPEISRLQPGYGEELRGIAVAVALAPSRRPVRVVLDVRQVCAHHFRNTFLYY